MNVYETVAGWAPMRFVDWDYWPTGPYLCFTSWWAFSVDEAPPDAWDWFGANALPPRPGRTAAILDSTGAMMVGYREDADRSDWVGTAFGFELLSAHAGLEPVDVAFWEMQARGELNGLVL